MWVVGIPNPCIVQGSTIIPIQYFIHSYTDVNEYIYIYMYIYMYVYIYTHSRPLVSVENRFQDDPADTQTLDVQVPYIK